MLAATLSKMAYNASKMAKPWSQPLHGPSISSWDYSTSGITPDIVRVASWNTNGIRSVIKKGKLQEFLTQYRPDILAINQTKLGLPQYQMVRQSIGLDELYLGEYHVYWNFCKVSAGYSGVATFSRFKPKAAVQDFQCQHMALQGRCLTLQFDKFYLVNCYKPNSGEDLSRLPIRVDLYDQKFTQYVNQLKKEKPVIIAGDLNVAHQEIDLARPKANRKNAGFTDQQRKSFSTLLQTGFVDSFRHLHPDQVKYTWWSSRGRSKSNNIGWRIDYILSSSQSLIKQSNIYDSFEGSDHCPIDCVLDFS